MTRALPAEFALAAACCRWPRSPARDAAVRAAASAAIDWPRLERVAARHRVSALVHDGLHRAAVAVPDATRRTLAARAAAAATDGLRKAAETLRIQIAFDAAGVPMLAIKGSALALIAYGELSIKQSWDIDVLTMPGEALVARHVLEDLGYVIIAPAPADDSSFVRYAGLTKECVLRHPTLGFSVELHWRLLDNAWLLPSLDARAPCQATALADGALRTFENDALFAYLCVHGTMHGWFRLKWLADVAALLSSRDIERLYRSALDFGAGHAPGVAVLLCVDLLGLDAPPALSKQLRTNRATAALHCTALACMTYGAGEAEFPAWSAPGVKLRLSWLRMAPGRGYLATEAARWWRSESDRMAIRLPRWLGFAYHLLRIPLWLSRRMRSAT